MSFHTHKFFFYTYDTALSDISYDSHKKKIIFFFNRLDFK